LGDKMPLYKTDQC